MLTTYDLLARVDQLNDLISEQFQLQRTEALAEIATDLSNLSVLKAEDNESLGLCKPNISDN